MSLTFIFICVSLLELAAAAKVTEVKPKEIGIGGGTALTVLGAGFANEFNYGTDNIGNTVRLRVIRNGKTISAVDCVISRPDTNRKQIVCYPTAGRLIEDTRYCIGVRVNTKWIPNRYMCSWKPYGDDCCITAKWLFTPTVNSIVPTSLTPGPTANITICGRLFTSRYGGSTTLAENGRTELITRVYASGQCELKDMGANTTDVTYGIYVEEDSDDGCMVCKPKTSYIGNANVTYTVDQDKGSSVADSDQLQVSWDGQLSMLQYFPVITDVSRNQGSRMGGQVVRVYSPNTELGGTPDSTYSKTRIFVGESEAEIIGDSCVKNSHYDIIVGPVPSTEMEETENPGSRGPMVEYWEDGTYATLDEIFNAPATSDREHFDESRFCGHEINWKQTRMTALFYARETGVYQFELRTTFCGKWYIENEVQGESWGGTWSSGDNWQLDEDQLYKITVVAGGPSCYPAAAGTTNPCIEFRAKFFTSDDGTKLYVGPRVPEKQSLRVNSVPTLDVQTLSFTNGTYQDPVYEVQKVCRQFDQSPKLRFGMFGSFTAYPLSMEHSGDNLDKLEAAINELPFLGHDESCLVEKDPVNPLCISITISSKRGNEERHQTSNEFETGADWIETLVAVATRDFPNWEVKPSTATVAEIIRGVPDNNMLSLMMDGRPSVPFSLADIDQPKMQEVVDSLFVTACPKRFWANSILREDFEGPRGGYYNTGAVVNHIETCCGSQSFRNPWRLYPNNNKITNPISGRDNPSLYLNFCFKGINNPRVDFLARDQVSGLYRWHRVSVDSFEAQDTSSWQYTSVNLKDALQDWELVDLRLRGNYKTAFYVDALSFATAPAFYPPSVDSDGDGQLDGYYISEMRLPPASPNPSVQVLMDHTEVVYEEETGYTVTFYPLQCGNNFDLIELFSSESLLSGDKDHGLTQVKGGDTEMSTTRSGWASPRVRGTVKVQLLQIKTEKIIRYLQKKKRVQKKPLTLTQQIRRARRVRRLEKHFRRVINVNSDDRLIQAQLESIPRIGRVRVEETARSTCQNREYVFTFMTKPGRQNRFKVLETHLNQQSATATIVRHVEGHFPIDPIPGDQFYSVHDASQIQVFINNVPAVCEGDCSYQWSDQYTPKVFSVEPVVGIEDTTLRISGQNFSSTPAENAVKIGHYSCPVAASTATMIECTVPAGVGKDLPVSVNVAGLGISEGDATFSYISTVTGTAPGSGSFGGGIEMEVSGTNFPENSEVLIDGQVCSTTAWSPTSISCMVPPSAVQYNLGDRTVEVSVRATTPSHVYTVQSPDSFSYMVEQTGIIHITDIPLTLDHAGGQAFSLTGEQFGSVQTLKIDGVSLSPDTPATVNEDNTTTVTFVTPPILRHDVPELCLDIDSYGCSVLVNSVSLPTLALERTVDSISPLQGSLYGGTVLEISGKRFGTDTDSINITVGGYQCRPLIVTDTRITCQIEYTYYVTSVTNMGDGELGPYFSCDPQNTDIYTGDTIEFQWSSPQFDAEEETWRYGIYQITDLKERVNMENGISSGPPTTTGSYSVTFDYPGEYLFWSGYLDEWNNTFYQCTVDVVPRESWAGDVVVMIAGEEAVYNMDLGIGSIPNQGDTSGQEESCQVLTQEMLGCSDPSLASTNLDRPSYSYLDCVTPVISFINYTSPLPEYPRGVTVLTEIAFTGVGIPSDACALEVTFGDDENACACEVVEITVNELFEGEFICIPEPECAQHVGLLRKIHVRVKGLGFALVKVPHYESYVQVLPAVTEITPDVGSVAGGTEVMLTVYGLGDINSFKFGTVDTACEIIDTNTVKCMSPKSNESEIDIGIIIDGFPVVCEISDANCTFWYDVDLTPVIFDVDRLEVDTANPVNITVTGEKFGSNIDDIEVTIGGEACVVYNLKEETIIECTLRGMPAGPGLVEVWVKGIGKAQSDKFIEGVPDLGLAMPDSGNVNGGENILKAESNKYVHGIPVLDLATPDFGSVNGGQYIRLDGHGFHKHGTFITIGEQPCVLKENEPVTVSSLVCKTPPAPTEGSLPIQITVEKADYTVTFPTIDFNYKTLVVIDSVTPNTGIEGESITLSLTLYDLEFLQSLGLDFENDTENIFRIDIGGTECPISAGTSTELPSIGLSVELSCTLGSHLSGPTAGYVYMEGLGNSNNFQFTYIMRLNSVSPASGNTKGGQLISVAGEALQLDDLSISICENPCRLLAGRSSVTELYCVTPPGPEGPCIVTVSDGNTVTSLESAFTYAVDVGPVISSIESTQSVAGDGIIVIITGSVFGTDPEAGTVTLNGNPCTPTPTGWISTRIDCEISTMFYSSGPVEVLVTVRRTTGPGPVKRQVSEAVTGYFEAEVWYVNQRWSNPFTWAPNNMSYTVPQEGEMVVIEKNQVVLLDIDTPILKMILIKGGKLIFDEEKESIQLNTENILITEGGELRIGTETQPYSKKAEIVFHGHIRCTELPIYGCKVLAVRDGKLEIHGTPVVKTWTLLSSPASPGNTEIRVPFDDVSDWVNNQHANSIIIATTGGYRSQIQTEQNTVIGFHRDEGTNEAILTLEFPLEYSHSAATETYPARDSARDVEMRAEVGLLSRNIVIRGSRDLSWSDVDPPICDPMAETVSPCITGRFGEELGSDQFGADIMIHQASENTTLDVHLEYVEMNYVGQAYRVGRYPVYFHMNGDMDGSYIRGCSIHSSFNRAVVIRGTNNVLITNNVVYNVLGSAFFIEEGVEVGNRFERNLAVSVLSTSGALNSDYIAAAFWTSNPDNVFIHNHAVGGFTGFWFSLPSHPTGLSSDESVCPQTSQLGEFSDNTAHSNEGFGLWTFQRYFPQTDGNCQERIQYCITAMFSRLTAFNNKIGAEFVDGCGLQCSECNLVQNSYANFRGVRSYGLKISYSVSAASDNLADVFYGLDNSVIVGRTTSESLWQPDQGINGVTEKGAIIPYGYSVAIQHTTFSNFDDAGTYTLYWPEIRGTCTQYCGGYPLWVLGLEFHNIIHRGRFRWMNEAIINDVDNSLGCRAHDAPTKILPSIPLLPPDTCVPCPTFDNSLIEAISCPYSMMFHKVDFNITNPSYLKGKDVIFSNEYGNLTGPYSEKREGSFSPGYSVILPDGYTYTMQFEGAEEIQNISLRAVFSDFKTADDGSPSCIILKVFATKRPDRFSYNGGSTLIPEKDDGIVECPTANHGDWIFNEENQTVLFAISANDPNGYKRTVSGYPDDIYIDLIMYDCYFVGCIPPPPKDNIPPSKTRIDDNLCHYKEWFQDPNNPNGVISSIAVPEGSNSTTPAPLDTIGGSSFHDNIDITVAEGDWVIVCPFDCLPPRIGRLILLGVMEFSDRAEDCGEIPINYEITASFVIIRGGRLIVGWPDKAFTGNFDMTLVDSAEPYEDVTWQSPVQGAHSILGVHGGLDLHGESKGETYSTVTETLNPGDNIIRLANNVSDWMVNDHIIVTSTSYDPHETEEAVIIEKLDDYTIVIDTPLKYKHEATVVTVGEGGNTYGLAAAVGLLSRNIKLRSEKSSGGYVLVTAGQAKDQDNNWVSFTGYARLSYVEFINMGQLGYTESYDARHALTFYLTSKRGPKPSDVQGCSFVGSHGTAIGVYDSSGIRLYNNVIYDTTGDAVVLAASGLEFVYNLIALILWTGTELSEQFNSRVEAGVNAIRATSLTMYGVYVSGSERAAYHMLPATYLGGSYNDGTANIAVASVMGWAIFPRDHISRKGTNFISGFKVWRTITAVYYNSGNSVQFSNLFLADNILDVFPMVYGPSAVKHECEHKTVKLTNSIVVAHTSSANCEHVLPTGTYMTLFQHCMPPRGEENSKIGVMFGQFTQGTNYAPATTEACFGTRQYMSLCGHMEITGVTFVNFVAFDNCPDAFPVAANPLNEDVQHPVYTSAISFIDDGTATPAAENNETRAYFPRPRNVGYQHCGDMYCDGLLHLLLQDEDGSFLGEVGATISDGGYEWNKPGTGRGGRGDHRIPKAMLIDKDGNRKQVEEVMTFPGIGRRKNSEYKGKLYDNGKDFGLYESLNTTYQMLVIESLDPDTETRSLGPVAVRVTVDGDSYLDLLSGPQDHTWRSGYKVGNRLSTYFAVVPDIPGIQVDLFLTSTAPETMRFFLLKPRTDSCLLVSFYLTNSMRTDVYCDRGIQRHYPQCTRLLNGDRLIYENEPVANCIPTCDHGACANYIDREEKMLYFILKGDEMIVIKRAKVVIVSIWLPDIKLDEFYTRETIVRNIAALLGVPANKVRIVKALTSWSLGSRRKRQTDGGLEFQIEIGDEPPPTAFEDTTLTDVNGAEGEDEGEETGETTPEPQQVFADTLMTACQDTTIVEALGVGSVTCESVQVQETVYVPTVPESLQFELELRPQHEGVPFAVQPKLRAFDSMGNVIHDLGIKENPWQVTARLRNNTGHPDAVFSGSTTITSINGWFNFTDLAISHAGQGYVIDFEITYPPTAAELHLNASSGPFDVEAVPMTGGLYAMTTGDLVENLDFSVTFELQDSLTGQTIEDISWRGHIFDIDCGLPSYTDFSIVSGNLSKSFDNVTGRVQFDGLSLSGYGLIVMECHVVSTPAEFDFIFYQKFYVVGSSQVGLQRDSSDHLTIRFKDNFTTVLPTDSDKAQLEQLVLQSVLKSHPHVIVIDSSVTEGSILVMFTVEGSLGNITALKQGLCDSIASKDPYILGSTTLTLDDYLVVDGQDYFGNNCGVSDSEDGLHPGYIALIVVAAVLLVTMVILLLLWKLHVIPKTKTNVPDFYKIYNNYTRTEPGVKKSSVEPKTIKSISSDNGKTVFIGGTNGNLFREGTLQSNTGDGAPPMTTLYSGLKLELRGTPDLNRTPTATSGLDSLFGDDIVTPRDIGRLTPTAD